MDFLQMLNDFFTKFDNILWGVPMIVILLGAHIYMTVRTKFVQRKTFKAIKLSVTKDPDSDGDISPFQALTTALASTIGTGNIIGVGTAIALGGASAVVLDFRRVWYCHKVCGVAYCGEIPCKNSRR